MKIKSSFILKYYYFPRRGYVTVSIAVLGVDRWTRVRQRLLQTRRRRLRYEKHENNADVPKYKAPNRYFHHVLR